MAMAYQDVEAADGVAEPGGEGGDGGDDSAESGENGDGSE